jgi:hypothetical protein
MFAYMSSVTYVIHLVSPSIAAFTMTRNLLLPFVIGVILLVIGALTTLIVPVVARKSGFDDDNASETRPLLNGQPLPIDRTPTSSLGEHIRKIRLQVTGRHNFQVSLSIFCLAAMASSNSPLFPQYISKRYDWTFANAGYLLSIKAAVNITLLALVIPSTVKLLATRSHLSPDRINRMGAIVMLMISVVGVLMIGFALTVPILVLCESRSGCGACYTH